jgi:hypothetical protein
MHDPIIKELGIEIPFTPSSVVTPLLFGRHCLVYIHSIGTLYSTSHYVDNEQM